MPTTPLSVDVYADIVCPFCYIGLKRVSNLAAERPLSLRWQPFQLNPGQPAGVAWRDFAPRKFGGQAAMRAAFQHVQNYACDDGLCFNLEGISSAPNTEDAHRLVLAAQTAGLGVPVAMRLMRGYFEEGADLNDADVLLRLATDGGLDEAAAREVLASDLHREALQQSQMSAQAAGVSGVPFYVLAGQYALSGAQPLETMRAALDWVVAQPPTPAAPV